MASGEGAGKGDKRRPCQISEQQYAKNYEAAFGKQTPWWSRPDHLAWVKEAEAERKRLSELLDA
jgi:hypothetical protein